MFALISDEMHTSACLGCGWTVSHLSPFYMPFHQHVSQCVWIEEENYEIEVHTLQFDDYTGYDTHRRVS